MGLMVYRQLQDAGMVLGLEQIRALEDRNLLAGHIALLFGNYVQVGGHMITRHGRCDDASRGCASPDPNGRVFPS
jgi:hypothetical protein